MGFESRGEQTFFSLKGRVWPCGRIQTNDRVANSNNVAFFTAITYVQVHNKQTKTNSVAFSPQVNYTD
jgi:hypothetical protein